MSNFEAFMFWTSMALTVVLLIVLVLNMIFGKPIHSRLSYNILLEQERQTALLKRQTEIATMERNNRIYENKGKQ